eukprot:scaffold19223_cov112-Isochrysis_galbana.AAC.1
MQRGGMPDRQQNCSPPRGVVACAATQTPAVASPSATSGILSHAMADTEQSGLAGKGGQHHQAQRGPSGEDNERRGHGDREHTDHNRSRSRSPDKHMSRADDYNSAGGGGTGNGDVRPGDWICPNCNSNVFASKSTCFRCQTPKSGT